MADLDVVLFVCSDRPYASLRLINTLTDVVGKRNRQYVIHSIGDYIFKHNDTNIHGEIYKKVANGQHFYL